MFLFLFVAASLFANPPLDCTKVAPISVLETIKADVVLMQHHKVLKDGSVAEVDEQICAGTLDVQVKDIRGREMEWYYCNPSSPNDSLKCQGSFKSSLTDMIVRPGMVIRSWQPSDVLHAHVHTYIFPTGNPDGMIDYFSRTLIFDLGARQLTLDGGYGGRGPATDQDGYYVRVRFYR